MTFDGGALEGADPALRPSSCSQIAPRRLPDLGEQVGRCRLVEGHGVDVSAVKAARPQAQRRSACRLGRKADRA
jgi:hypothetical protein